MNPRVLMTTSLGPVTIELFAAQAPVTVANFLSYVDDRFYDGTLFHRVIPDFMIQGGGYLPGLQEKQTRAPIKNEASNGLSNRRGTVAMARTDQPHSATSQFFINTADNTFLDQAECHDGVGYCVFGRVVEGMEVVDRIQAVATGSVGPHDDVPVRDVTILSVRRIEAVPASSCT